MTNTAHTPGKDDHRGPLTEQEVNLLQYKLRVAESRIDQLEDDPWHSIVNPPPDRSRVLMTNKSKNVWIVKAYESRDGFCATHWMFVPTLPVQEENS